MEKAKIRLVNLNDAERILQIYRPYVENTAITFEYTVPTLEEFKNRIASIVKKYPYIVAEIDGKIAKSSNIFLNEKEGVIQKKMEKSSRFEAIYFVFGIIVGTLGFVVLNRTMDIYYFGFRGMFLTWATCVCIATFVVAPIVGQLLMWVIGIGLVIIAYKVIKNKGENTIEE